MSVQSSTRNTVKNIKWREKNPQVAILLLSADDFFIYNQRKIVKMMINPSMNMCIQSFDQGCVCSLSPCITVLSVGFGQHAEQRTDCDGVVQFSARRVQNSTLHERQCCSICACTKDQHLSRQPALPSARAAQHHHRPPCCRYSSQTHHLLGQGFIILKSGQMSYSVNYTILLVINKR